MKKYIICITAFVLMVIAALSGCGRRKNTPQTEKVSINAASLKGPTSIGLVRLYDESDNKRTFNSYSYSIYGNADEITTGLIKGSIDVAAIPANLASVLYNKTGGGIKIAGINTLGVLYILAKGCQIESVESLKGHTIYTTGQGTTPEYTLRHILSANGLNPDKDVRIEFLSEAPEVLAKCMEMDTAVLMLPEPYVEAALIRDSALSVVIDTTKEWEDVVTGVTVVRSDFYESQKDAFLKFMEEYEASVNYALDDTRGCAALVGKFGIFKSEIAEEAVKKSNVTFIQGKEASERLLKYYQALYEENPASVGGRVPDGEAFIN